MRKFMFAAGMAVGYVLGSKAGRERYEQIADVARRICNNPTVHNTATTLREQAEQMAGASKEKLMHSELGHKLFGEESRKKSESDSWEKPGVTAPAKSGTGSGGATGGGNSTGTGPGA